MTSIWLLKIGEPWPTREARLYRTGINAEFLSNKGHHVTWWLGTFNHLRKQETPSNEMLTAEKGPRLRLEGLRGGGYARNVSIQRILYHRRVAQDFLARADQLPTPDILVVSLTPLELAEAAIAYGKKKGVPVIVDVRDMWPDIWLYEAPPITRPAAALLLRPYFNKKKSIMRNATSIIGITDSAIDWAFEGIGRRRGEGEKAFPLIYPAKTYPADELAKADVWWKEQGVEPAKDRLIGAFFGTITKRADFCTPIMGLRALPMALRDRVTLVLCGDGEAVAAVKALAHGLSTIVLPGHVNGTQIRSLMGMSAFGLLPYIPTLDFVRSLPNKVFEYLSGGLPILTSLRGDIELLLTKYDCGMLYTNGAPVSFQECLKQMLEYPTQRASMVAGAKRAASDFSTENICEEFEAYLLNAVAQNRRFT